MKIKNLFLILIFFISMISAAYATDHVVISEVMYNAPTGVESGKEWIEIYNPTPNPIDISNWRVDKVPTSSSDPVLIFPAGTIIQSYTHVLVGDTKWNSTFNITAPDFKGDVSSLSNSAQAVFIINSSFDLIDGIGWGGSVTCPVEYPNCYEGTRMASIVSDGYSIERKIGTNCGNAVDTNNNTADFFSQPKPNPQNKNNLSVAPCTGDTTAPVMSVVSVNGDTTAPYNSTMNTTTVIVSLNENGDCRMSDIDESYDNMYNNIDCTGDGTMQSTCIHSVQPVGIHMAYIACKDMSDNKNSDLDNLAVTYIISQAPQINYPPIISNINVHSITNQSAVISWQTDELSDSSVAYGEPGKNGTVILPFGYSLQHSIGINNLTANTTYVFSVKSCDYDGNCSTSNISNFTTLLNLAVGHLPDLIVTEASALQSQYDNEGYLTLNISVKNIGNKNITNEEFAIVVFVTDENFETGFPVKWYIDTNSLVNQEKNYIINVTDINDSYINNYKIHFEVFANGFESINESNYSNNFKRFSVPVKITVVSPPPAVTNLHVMGVTNSSIAWGWTNPTDLNFTTSLVYIDDAVAPISLLNPLNRYNKTGLQANSTHTIRINTKNFFGEINYTNVTSSATTLANQAPVIEEYPLNISNVQYGSVTDHSAVITWQTNKLSNSKVYYGETDSLEYPTATDSSMVLMHSVTLNDLKPNTNYKFMVESCVSVNNCTSSETVYNFNTVERQAYDDLMVNYVKGKILTDGAGAASGTSYTIRVISGTNSGFSYTGTVDQNVPDFLKNQGLFDTRDNVIFNTGDRFTLTSNLCSGSANGTFENGGNGDFNNLSSLIVLNCNVPPVIHHASYSPSLPKEGNIIRFIANVTDTNLDKVWLRYQVNAGNYISSDMSFNGSYYVAEIGPFVAGTQIDAGIDANDSSGNRVDVIPAFVFTIMPSNTAPIFNPALTNQNVQENNTLNYDINATDADYDLLTFSSNITNLGGSINSLTGLITLTPDDSYVGKIYNVMVTVCDNSTKSNSCTAGSFAISVSEVNDAPRIGEIPPIVLDEHGFNADTILKNYVDDEEDGNNLTWSVTGDLSHINTLVNRQTSILNVSSIDHWHGSKNITLTATDSGGLSASTIVTVTVNNINDIPMANNQSLVTEQETLLNITLTATDADNDNLTYFVISLPSHGRFINVNNSGAPSLFYMPNLNYSGNDSFTFKVNDGNDDSNTAVVSIRVTKINHKPVADNQSATTNEDTNKSIVLTANDVDGDSIAYSIVTGPSHGTLSGTMQNIVYKPAGNYSGNDSFTFKANDGMSDSNIAIVSITVDPINDAPYFTSIPGGLNAVEGIEYVYDANANDVDNNVSDLRFSPVNIPAGASIDELSGNVTWIPDASQIGPKEFEIRVSDGTDYSVQKFNVSVVSALDIVNIKINGNSFSDGDTIGNWVPGQNLDVSFDVINRFPSGGYNAMVDILTDTEINGHKIAATPKFNLEGQQTKTISDRYQIPFDIAGTSFELVLDANGQDLYEKDYNADDKVIHFSVDRDFHRLNITSKNWSRDRLGCNRTTTLSVGLANTGSWPEQGTINVYNRKTNTNLTSDFSLGIAEMRIFTFNVDASAANADENFDISVKYRFNYYSINEAATLRIRECAGPSIEGYTPNYNPLVGDGDSQRFSINISDPDGLNPIINWYVNGNLSQTNGNEFSFASDRDYTVKVNITNSTTHKEQVWNVRVSKIPVTAAFSGTIRNVNEANVGAFTGLTMSNGNGIIDFGSQAIDLSDVVDVDRYIVIGHGYVSIDSNFYNTFRNKHATITLYGLRYNEMPKIYYNDGFTTNPTEINNLCGSCALLNYTQYPTTNGEVMFSVAGFSSYKILETSVPTPPTPVTGTGVLKIKDVDISEDKPKPDQDVEIQIDIRNEGELDIEDIDLEIKLLDKNGDIVEDENDDELEDDDNFDIDSDDKEELTFKFKMPATAEDGDTYRVYVKACGDDENNKEECALDNSSTIKIEKEKHEVVIYSAVVSPSALSCYNSFDVEVGIKNIGEEDEDVRLTVSNSEMELSKSETFTLEAEDEDTYKKEASYSFSAPSDLAEGVYPITIKADYGEETLTKTLQLTKSECREQPKQQEQEEVYEPLVYEPEVKQISTPKQTEEEAQKEGFRDSFEYTVMLIILSVLAIGLIIFIIGAMALKNKGGKKI